MFNNLAPRERIMVIGGTLAAVVILLYSIVWAPWQEELERLRNRVPAKQETLAWMQAQAQRAAALSAEGSGGVRRGSSASGLPLLTLVERSANQLEMREVITRMSPGDEANQVRVWMDDVSFDRWLQWIDALGRDGIGVAEANIDRSEQNLVSIRATLQR